MKVEEATELFAALGHKHRLEILVAMWEAEKPISPNQISERIDVSLGVVSYHIRVMQKRKLIRLTRVRPVRGATEHFYTVSKRGHTALGILELRR